jgi:hypothetical protein
MFKTILNFGHLIFGFVSDFGFRASDFMCHPNYLKEQPINHQI